MTTRPRRTAGALLALFIFGCNDSNDGGSSGGGGGTGENFARLYAEAHCTSIEACCNAEDFAFELETCVETLVGLLGPAVEATLREPNIEFDGDAAARCLAHYRTAVSACDDRELAEGIDNECEGIFRGTVPEGGECQDDDECAQPASGQVLCDDDDVCRRVEDDVPPGGSPRAGLGDPCRESCSEGATWGACFVAVPGATSNARCYAEDNLYCSPDAVCAPAPGVGEPCPGFACDAVSYCSNGTCVARTATGPCDAGYECVSTSRCESDICVPNTMNGEACESSIECQSVHCAGGTCRNWSLATPATCAGEGLAGAY